MAQAQCGTIRLRLLKIGGQIRVSVGEVWISMSSGFALPLLFQRVYQNLLPQPQLSPARPEIMKRGSNLSRRHA